MATYVVLANYTDQGMKDAKNALKRAEGFKEMAAKFGVTVKDVYWTQGQYDIVVITEASDEISATALGLTVAAMGNVRSETLRAFSTSDMTKIIAKMP